MQLNIALSDFLRSLRAAGRRPRTIEWYEQMIGAYTQWLEDNHRNG